MFGNSERQQQTERQGENETDGLITEKSDSNTTLGGQFRQQLQERERQEKRESSLSERDAAFY